MNAMEKKEMQTLSTVVLSRCVCVVGADKESIPRGFRFIPRLLLAVKGMVEKSCQSATDVVLVQNLSAYDDAQREEVKPHQGT